MNTGRPDDTPAAVAAGEAAAPGGAGGAVMLAMAVIALGAFVVFEALTGPANPGYAQVGPGVFPFIVGTALLLAGLCLLLQSARGHWRVVWIDNYARSSVKLADAPHRNVLIVAIALALDVALMQPLGYIVASTVLFALVAAAYGSRRFYLDASLGLIFSGAIYLIFMHGLGLNLPIGRVWEGAPWMR